MLGRSLRIALAVSIVLNLFLLGAIGGGAVMWARTPHGHAGGRGRPIGRAGDGLSALNERRFHAMMREALISTRQLQHDAQRNRRAAADLFVQPSFDATAVSAALSRARDADFALRIRLEGAVVDFAKTLPQGERATLAQGLARGGPLRHPSAGEPRP